MFVMGGAVCLNMVSFYYIIHKKGQPFIGEKLDLPTNKKIDWPLIVGSAIFGIG